MDAEMDSVITNTGVSGSTLMKQEKQFYSTNSTTTLKQNHFVSGG
ncbi:hypothetical protein T03_161 [Trichinella britovi]|uniref:Uncharacterized protein n=1 Tax=Trichinella britovi TaxID=45882 RepID=A0A0V0YYU0_TRIBR|nr:hypothetical protein T03_161 [Trichinella britovi]